MISTGPRYASSPMMTSRMERRPITRVIDAHAAARMAPPLLRGARARRLWRLGEPPHHAVIILLIAISLITVALESVPGLAAHYGGVFLAIELLALVVFSAEYALRLW